MPTLGRLRDEGALVLSLVTVNVVGDRDTMSAAVRKMKFVNG